MQLATLCFELTSRQDGMVREVLKNPLPTDRGLLGTCLLCLTWSLVLTNVVRTTAPVPGSNGAPGATRTPAQHTCDRRDTFCRAQDFYLPDLGEAVSKGKIYEMRMRMICYVVMNLFTLKIFYRFSGFIYCTMLRLPCLQKEHPSAPTLLVGASSWW